ncbi:hypothetical protein BKA56DRAFT_727664 [Ilyonectria sp. MPI-CAGE-AT-0026]|nr:hypothetical protein BKA56DRAFT_727664 [Ilyonectria sp. MPI-CAGE-AT-0026]
MKYLPPEILLKIALCLIENPCWEFDVGRLIPNTSLASYATVSRLWQSIVETITFRYLVLSPTKIAAPEANRCLVPARLGHLRYIWFEFEFPAHDLDVSTNPEEDYDDQFVFTRSVRQFFGILTKIPPRPKPSVRLEFFISPPMKYLIPWNSVNRVAEGTKVAMGEVGTTYLELDAHWDQGIPDLPAISYFRVDLHSRSLVYAPSSINLITSKMPRLKKVEWWLSDAEKVDANVRIHQRTMFAHTLDKLPQSLEAFRLEYVREPPRDRYFRAPSIVPSDAPGDILSQELYKFSQRDGLKEFFLNASVDCTILWPRLQQPNDNPHWPTLTLFHIELNDVLPTGQWIEIRDHNEYFELRSDDDDPRWSSEIPGEEHERTFPSTFDQAIMNQFALAAGRRASHMPNIKEFYVFHHGKAPMGIGFVTRILKTPCLEFSGQGGAGPSRALEPNDETLNAWRDAVRVHGLEWKVDVVGDGHANLFH